MAVVFDVAMAVRSDKSSRQVFAGRAGVMVLFGVVDEVLPGEQATLSVARCQYLWHTGQHAGVLACQYLIAVEIAPISQNSDLLVSRRLLRPECHRYELCSIMAYIRHLVRHDQVVLDVDRGLHIVADDAGAFAAGRHCASIWIRSARSADLARRERSPSLAGAASVASGGRACPLAESIWLRRPRPLADRLCPVPISSVRYWLRPAPYDARSHRACSSCPDTALNRLPSIAITKWADAKFDTGRTS